MQDKRPRARPEGEKTSPNQTRRVNRFDRQDGGVTDDMEVDGEDYDFTVMLLISLSQGTRLKMPSS